MAVPEEIRNVERPTNTVVVQRGGGPRRYAVVERIGCKRVDGRNVPVNGYTVGHIMNGAFVPLADPVGRRKVEIKDWADIVLVDRVSRPLLDDLMGVYEAVDAMRVFCQAKNPGRGCGQKVGLSMMLDQDSCDTQEGSFPPKTS